MVKVLHRGRGVQADALEIPGEVDSEQEEADTFDHAPLHGVRVEVGHLLLQLRYTSSHCNEFKFQSKMLKVRYIIGVKYNI